MSGLLALLLAPVIGYLVGRWWIAGVLAPVYAAPIVVVSIVQNYDDPCTRPDGCGTGPVLFASLVAVALAVLVAGLTALGVWMKRRAVSARREAGALGPPGSS